MNIKLKNLLLLLLIIFLLYLVYNRCNNICDGFSIGVPKIEIKDELENVILHTFESEFNAENMHTINKAKQWLQENRIDYVPGRHFINEVLDIDEGGDAELVTCGESGIPSKKYGFFQQSSGITTATAKWPTHKKYFKIENNSIKIYKDDKYTDPDDRHIINICELNLDIIQSNIKQENDNYHFRINLDDVYYYIWATESNIDMLSKFHSTIIKIIRSNIRENNIKKIGKFKFMGLIDKSSINKSYNLEKFNNYITSEHYKTNAKDMYIGINIINNTIKLNNKIDELFNIDTIGISININELRTYTIAVELIGLEKIDRYSTHDPITNKIRPKMKMKNKNGVVTEYTEEEVHQMYRQEQDEYNRLIINILNIPSEYEYEPQFRIPKKGILPVSDSEIELDNKLFIEDKQTDVLGILPNPSDSDEYLQKIYNLALRLTTFPFTDEIKDIGKDDKGLLGYAIPGIGIYKKDPNIIYEDYKPLKDLEKMKQMFKVNYKYYIIISSNNGLQHIFETKDKEKLKFLIDVINHIRKNIGKAPIIKSTDIEDDPF